MKISVRECAPSLLQKEKHGSGKSDVLKALFPDIGKITNLLYTALLTVSPCLPVAFVVDWMFLHWGNTCVIMCSYRGVPWQWIIQKKYGCIGFWQSQKRL